MFVRFPLFFLLFLSFLSAPAFAGVWVRPAHSYYLDLSFSYYQAKKLFNRRGDKLENFIFRDPNDPFSQVMSTTRFYDTTLYVEYGLGWNFQLEATLPIFVRTEAKTKNFTDFSTQGIGDAILGLVYQIWTGSGFVVSTVVDLGIPSGNESATDSPSGVAPQILPLGSGEWNVALGGLLGKSFWPFPAYFTGGIGYRFRQIGQSGRTIDDIPWFFDAGLTWNLRDSAWFSELTTGVLLEGLLALGSLSIGDIARSSPAGSVPGEEFLNIVPQVFLVIYDGLSWYASYTKTFTGTNTGCGWALRAGLAWER